MRTHSIVLILLLLAACGRGETTLGGTVAEGEDLTHVWVLGGAERAEIVGDSFSLAGIRDDAMELRFSRGDREVGRMELQEIPRGAEIRLRGIAVDDDIAFPLAVESADDVSLRVNGVRLGSPGTVPGRVDVRAVLLSRSRTGDAMLVRPEGESLPDLRVIVTPGTEVRTPDGDPASLERTDFGDTLRIVGSGEAGFVIATVVEVPRARVISSRTGPAAEPDVGGGVRATTSSVGGAVPSSPPPAVRESPSRASEGERGRGQGRGRGPPEGRGEGRGQGRDDG
jgi:hypothetical protein